MKESYKVHVPGHRYAVLRQYNEGYEQISFPMRHSDPFTSHVNTFPGTTVQAILRVCIDRLQYMGRHGERKLHKGVVGLLTLALWIMEYRAAKQKGKAYPYSLQFALRSPVCPVCGKTSCRDSCY